MVKDNEGTRHFARARLFRSLFFSQTESAPNKVEIGVYRNYPLAAPNEYLTLAIEKLLQDHEDTKSPIITSAHKE